MKTISFLIFLGLISILFFPQIIDAKEYFPSIQHRVDGIPTFCTKVPPSTISNELKASEEWTSFVEDAVLYWKSELKKSSEYPEVWDMKFKKISEDVMFPLNCTVILQYEQFHPEGWDGTLGVFYAEEWWEDDPTNDNSDASKILIFDETFGCYGSCENYNHEKTFHEVIVHEIGHSLGLGHFTYDESLKKVVDGKAPFPSIMYPSNSEFVSDAVITSRDISKLEKIYGTWGFYAFSESRPTNFFNDSVEIVEGIMPEEKIFTNTKISEEKIHEMSNRYEKKILTISGTVFNSNSWGHPEPVVFQLIFPDKTTKTFESHIITTNDFSVPIVIDSTFPVGIYYIEPSFNKQSSEEFKIKFEIIPIDKSIIKEEKIEEKVDQTRVKDLYPSYGYDIIIPEKIKLTFTSDNEVSGHLIPKRGEQKDLTNISLYLFFVIDGSKTLISSTAVNDDLTFTFNVQKGDMIAWEDSLPVFHTYDKFGHVTGETTVSSGSVLVKAFVGFDKVLSNKSDSEKHRVVFTIDASNSKEIPLWIKNNAGWWADGTITDRSFIQGIQYLIKNKIISVTSTDASSSSNSKEIPLWIKNNAGWWADGTITDNDFMKGLEYLVQNRIIDAGKYN